MTLPRRAPGKLLLHLCARSDKTRHSCTLLLMYLAVEGGAMKRCMALARQSQRKVSSSSLPPLVRPPWAIMMPLSLSITQLAAPAACEAVTATRKEKAAAAIVQARGANDSLMSLSAQTPRCRSNSALVLQKSMSECPPKTHSFVASLVSALMCPYRGRVPTPLTTTTLAAMFNRGNVAAQPCAATSASESPPPESNPIVSTCTSLHACPPDHPPK